jgi:HK97 family phage prohead protease
MTIKLPDDGVERRILNSGPIELRRAAGEKQVVTLRGYAALFNTLSEVMWGFREQIAPGAFSDVLADDVRALFNHDPSAVLGRTVSGTLRIAQDANGLSYEVDLPNTQAARDLITSIERGDVSQSSFGFCVAPNGENWGEDKDGIYVRTITKFSKLYDVSPVTYAAYPDANVGLRSLEHWKASHAPQPDAFAVMRKAEARARKLTLLRTK